MKKKKTPTARKTTRRTPQSPTLTDPHLTALLLYIGDLNDDDDGRSARVFARVQARATAMLRSQPLTTAFSLRRDGPDIHEQVLATLREDLKDWTDPKDIRRAFDAIEAAWHEDSDDMVPPNDVRDIVPSFIDHAMYLGACLMYGLLTGGAR